MNSPPVRLEDLRIASPCPVSWDSMSGGERVRHCRECGLNVYDISRMTRAEAERLVSTTEGRLCGRLYRRADGTVLTADCPVGWRAVKRRTARTAGAALTALLGLFTSGFGQTPAAKQQDEACRQQLTLRRVRVAAGNSQPEAKTAPPLSGTILDPMGGFIANSLITLADEKTKETRRAVADAEGHYEFPALPAGSYTLTVEAAGFKSLIVPALEIRAEETVRADATLLIDDTMVMGIVSLPLVVEDVDRSKPILRVNGQIIRYED